LRKRVDQGTKKHRGRVVAITVLVCAAAAAAVIFAFRNRAGGKEKVAYVDSVASWAGEGQMTVNRFAGVVESQDTWSVQQKPDSKVKEILVKEGDTVTVGTPLLTYDTGTYQDQLSQSQIDLERLQNEAASIRSTIAELTKQKAAASSAEKGTYTVQVQEQELSAKQKEIDIKAKQGEIDKLNTNIAESTVTSQIDGIVRSVKSASSDGDTMSSSMGTGDDSDQALLTIMKTGELRVRGSVNEQNIGELSKDQEVIVYSRVNSQTWKGTVTSIDTESIKKQDQPDDSGDTTSSSYPFYVALESSEGLMLGQHVYLEPDYGQQKSDDAVRLPDYLIADSDGDSPFVWMEQKGKLIKQDVTLGDFDEETGMYVIKEGLRKSDQIAMPDDSLHAGMKTAPISEMSFDEDSGDDGVVMDGSGAYEGDGMMTEDGVMSEDGTMSEDGAMFGTGTAGDGSIGGMAAEEGR
jgi:HlyD family secretion protein